MTMSYAEARDFLLTHREDYDTACAGFRWPRPEHFNWALDWFDGVLAAEAESRNRPALRIVDVPTGAEQVLSFVEMSRRSDRVANHLRYLGVARGDRILLMLGNTVPLWETMLAAMKLGAVVIPATTLLSPEDLDDRLERGRVRHVIAAAEHCPKFETLDRARGLTRIAADGTAPGWVRFEDAHDDARFDTAFTPDGKTNADDDLLLYFTSGTTAKPKLVIHTHASYPIGHLSTMYWLGLKPGDLHLNVSSPGWAKHAWSCVFAPWIAGATVFIANQPRFDAASLLETIARCGVTTICAPPTVWRMFIQQDLSQIHTQLREVCGAGEPLNPEIIDQVKAAWGLTIRDGYGQTETSAQFGNPPAQPIKPGSMGRSLPGYVATLLDADDNEAEEGEISLRLGDNRPAGLMRGYEAASGKALLATAGDHYRTGDVATRDADGYFTFVGRADDVFKASDYRISPFELESVLIEHDAVAEAAVVPSPDPLRLAVPKAYVSLIKGFEPDATTARDILAYVRGRVAPYKRIRRIEFTDDLPKTISGKIRRVELRRGEAAGEAPETRDGIAFSEDDFPDLKG
ncbi:AMP-binding protein [Tistrella bauzanensis]|uniref:AMP-binding protein n=1 Tax=Tistrella arctica TaxID=3133430 RepID=A0ABU9YF80_9PROT